MFIVCDGVLSSYLSYDTRTNTTIRNGLFPWVDVPPLVDRDMAENTSIAQYESTTEAVPDTRVFYNLLKHKYRFPQRALDFLEPIIQETVEYMGANQFVEPIPDDFWEPVRLQLSIPEFKKLNNRVMGKKLLKELNIEKGECAICQEDITSRQHCTILTCNHIYHKNCAKEWFTKQCEKPTCPCCRADVRESLMK